MQYIRSTQNPSGAYAGPKSNPFPGCLPMTDAQAATLVQYNGFVTITKQKDEYGAISYTVEPNLEAWETWKASLPPEPEPEPTDTEALIPDIVL